MKDQRCQVKHCNRRVSAETRVNKTWMGLCQTHLDMVWDEHLTDEQLSAIADGLERDVQQVQP